jgi:arylsulfatase A-like enzyme
MHNGQARLAAQRGTLLAAALMGLSGCSDPEIPDPHHPPGRPDAGRRDAGAPHDNGGGAECEPDAGADDAGSLDAGGGDAGDEDERPNILLIVADDLGYSDIGAFGGEIHTPNLDLLASEGRILTDHHSGFTCAPTRSMLISGTDHHLVGLGRMGAGSGAQAGQPGYEGYLNDRALSIAELLRDGGYHTYIAGKWHLGSGDTQTPLHRGYESSYVLLGGVDTHFPEPANPPSQTDLTEYRENGQYVLPPADFYSTNFYTDKLISYIEANRADGKPFYAFAAYTSPHWPMQAPAEFIDRYRGRYDEGHEVIRARRLAKQKTLGIIPEAFVENGLLPETATLPKWASLTPEQRAIEVRKMEVYAAMVENLDWNIGRLIRHLKQTGEYDNTFIFFQSDNGPESGRGDRASANNTLENIGKQGSYVYVGTRWAEVSATPFRLFKSQPAEGGHSVPAIARLPRQHQQNPRFDGLTHLTDLAPTFLELASLPDPGDEYHGRAVHPITGLSLLPVLEGSASVVRDQDSVLADEQNNGRYVIRGRWKLLWVNASQYVASPGWELFDLENDRGETRNVAAEHPDVVEALIREWDAYVARTGTILLSPDAGTGGGGGASGG